MNLSIPESRPGYPPADAAGGQQFNVHTVLVAIRCWWHIALPVGLLSALTAMVAVYYLTPPTYTAQAWLYIREQRPILVTSAIQEDSGKFRHNQMELMKSPPILGPVTSNPVVATTPEIAKEADPVGYLRRSLKIRTLGGSDYYLIEFTSVMPDKAKEIVNRVADEYYGLSERHESKLTQDMIGKLIEHQVDQQQHVENLRNRVEKLAKEVGGKEGGGAWKVSGGEGAVISAENRAPGIDLQSPMAGLRSRLLNRQLEQVLKGAELEANTQISQEESFEPSDAEVDAYVEAMPIVATIRARIAEDRLKAAEHSQRMTRPVAGAPANQAALDLANRQKRIADSDAELEKNLVEFRKEAKVALEKASRAKRQNEIETLRTQKQRIDLEVKVLQTQVTGEKQQQQELAGNSTQLEFARAEFDMGYQFLKMISERIMRMQTERQAPERIQIFQYASTPTRPDMALPYKKMGTFGGVALLAPFALAVALELLNRRVSNRLHFETASQIAVVGEITSLPARLKGKTRKNAGNYERQLFEESVDGLRTYLTLIEALNGRKVLAVTSAISREGKTSLSSQLAVSISSATNRPTLLIDGDMRSPDIHRIFEVDRAPGLSEVLRGECPVEEVIETGFSDTLHIITAGNLDMSPHRIMGDGNFAELLVKLRGTYDYIILDTPPILPASEALLMAKAADAAILCVRRDYSRIDQVVHAFSRLRTAGVQTVGAVLNGVPARHYAYRYGSYYYTRRPMVAVQAEQHDPQTV
jgi:polysaccharide biosynthesis transport protein